MPEFANPFSGIVPDRKLTTQELIRALRLDVAAELEAVHLYMAHAEATDDPLAKKVLIDVANEEREHMGEFMHLIQILTGDENDWLQHGIDEVNEMAEATPREGKTNVSTPEGTSEETLSGNLTVGTLKD